MTIKESGNGGIWTPCQYRTLVHARPPGTEGGEHGERVVKMPWAERSSRFTALMEPLVIGGD